MGNEVETDACLNDYCGVVRRRQSPTGVEGCDDGNVDPGDGCDGLCRLESCGNGRVDAGRMRRQTKTTPTCLDTSRRARRRC